MDNLTYNYDKEANGSSHWLISNRLYHYSDAQSTTAETSDLENTASSFDDANASVNTTNNFGYDAIGNLTRDESEEIADITWDTYGKIKQITRTSGSTKPDLLFLYTPTGERGLKVEMTKNTDGTLTAASAWAYTAYMRDASGNVMNTMAGTGPSSLANEYGIYGSSRLGTWSPNTASTYLDGLSARGDGYRLAGDKTYELTNHLGNVMVTVNDKKLGYDNNADNKANNYHADVLSMNDYYAFGMPMPGRAYSSPSYRYGFNGKEKDDEVKGGGNSIDFGARIYDPRLSRWFSVDPLFAKFTSTSPFVFTINNPICLLDYDGRDIYWVNSHGAILRVTKATIKKIDNPGVRQGFEAMRRTAMGKQLFKDLSHSKTTDWYLAVGDPPGLTEAVTIKAERDKNGIYIFDGDKNADMEQYEITFNQFLNRSSNRKKVAATLIDNTTTKVYSDWKGISGGYLAAASSLMADLIHHEGTHAIWEGGNNQEHDNMGISFEKSGSFTILYGGFIYRFLNQLSKSYDKLILKATRKNDENLIDLYTRNKQEVETILKNKVVRSKEFYKKRQKNKN